MYIHEVAFIIEQSYLHNVCLVVYFMTLSFLDYTV
jgi:hypothetical protein